MKLLALETSSEAGSIALALGVRTVERAIPEAREQSRQLIGLIGAVLGEAGLEPRQLDAIVIGRGPGSFTGIRISAAVAQGLAMAAGLPVLPVSSLAAHAQRAWREHALGRTLVCVDARMGEVYSAAFRVAGGLAGPLGPERLTAPAAVTAPAGGAWAGVGSGFGAYPLELEALSRAATATLPALRPAAVDLLPQARQDLDAGRGCPPEAALPVYLREREAWRRHRR